MDVLNQSDRNLLRQIRTGQVVDTPPAVTAPAAGPAKTPELSPCPISPEYDEIIKRAYHNMYEPGLLGDFEKLRNKYNCQIKNVDDAVRFADEALRVSKDPYNTVFDKKQSEARGKESSGVWHGFGFQFAPKSDTDGKPGLPSPLRVNGAIPKSPVAGNGIKSGEYIIAVNGVSLKGKTFDEAYKLVQSDAPKQFKMMKSDGKTTYDVNLTPADIDTPAVTEKRLPNNIAYINVSTFGQKDTADEMQEAIKKHMDADGFIVDLRRNPGGFFDESIRAASLFVKEGAVVSVRQRLAPTAEKLSLQLTPPDVSTMNPFDGTAISITTDSSLTQVSDATTPAVKIEPPKPNYEKVTYELKGDQLLKVRLDEGKNTTDVSSSKRLPDLVDKPTVILVDEASASSSEVFTGALKDHGDAVVVGQKTYGKGIGQMNYYNMPGGSTLRVTNFHYFTPSGFWPGDANNNRIGITPDVIVANPLPAERGTDKDLQLKTAIEQINKKLGRP